MNSHIDKISTKFKEYMFEATSGKKRYVATIELYVWADNDADAKKNAEKIATALDNKLDNDASVTSLYEQLTGTLDNRKIFDKAN